MSIYHYCSSCKRRLKKPEEQCKTFSKCKMCSFIDWLLFASVLLGILLVTVMYFTTNGGLRLGTYLGLCFDIVGAYLLATGYFDSMVQATSGWGGGFDDLQKLAPKQSCKTKTGIFLLIIGFVFQAFGNYKFPINGFISIDFPGVVNSFFTFNYWEALTAIGTLFLASVTAIMVWNTRSKAYVFPLIKYDGINGYVYIYNTGDRVAKDIIFECTPSITPFLKEHYNGVNPFDNNLTLIPKSHDRIEIFDKNMAWGNNGCNMPTEFTIRISYYPSENAFWKIKRTFNITIEYDKRISNPGYTAS